MFCFGELATLEMQPGFLRRDAQVLVRIGGKDSCSTQRCQCRSRRRRIVSYITVDFEHVAESLESRWVVVRIPCPRDREVQEFFGVLLDRSAERCGRARGFVAELTKRVGDESKRVVLSKRRRRDEIRSVGTGTLSHTDLCRGYWKKALQLLKSENCSGPRSKLQCPLIRCRGSAVAASEIPTGWALRRRYDERVEVLTFAKTIPADEVRGIGNGERAVSGAGVGIILISECYQC